MSLRGSLIYHCLYKTNSNETTHISKFTTIMLRVVLLCIYVFLFAALVRCSPISPDLESAASGDDDHGRVQIKVFRGPTEHDGHDHFAPWGYWVKEPADHHY